MLSQIYHIWPRNKSDLDAPINFKSSCYKKRKNSRDKNDVRKFDDDNSKKYIHIITKNIYNDNYDNNSNNNNNSNNSNNGNNDTNHNNHSIW